MGDSTTCTTCAHLRRSPPTVCNPCNFDRDPHRPSNWRPLADLGGPEIESLNLRGRLFTLGDRVTKTRGSSWTGHVVGFYTTNLTPRGYAVESENEPGSVQIYPESALRRLG